MTSVGRDASQRKSSALVFGASRRVPVQSMVSTGMLQDECTVQDPEVLAQKFVPVLVY